MITVSDVVRWSHARAASHALTQPFDVDADDGPPAIAEVNELVIVARAGQRHEDAPPTEASLLEAHAPYSGQTELPNLVIWVRSTQHSFGAGSPDVGPEILPRLEPSAAFHELDVLRSDDRLALQAIRRLQATQIPYRDSLAARLERLLRAYQEDYEDRSLSASAIDFFINFLNAYPNLRRSRLSATPLGDLYAEWTAAADILFGVRFMPSGEVQYVLFTPNPLHRGRTDRTSGTTTADALFDRLQLSDQQWLLE